MIATGVIEYYKAGDGWRWRLVAANGEPLCHGGEGFASKQSCIESIKTTVKYFAGTKSLNSLHVSNDDVRYLTKVEEINGSQKV